MVTWLLKAPFMDLLPIRSSYLSLLSPSLLFSMKLDWVYLRFFIAYDLLGHAFSQAADAKYKEENMEKGARGTLSKKTLALRWVRENFSRCATSLKKARKSVYRSRLGNNLFHQGGNSIAQTIFAIRKAILFSLSLSLQCLIIITKRRNNFILSLRTILRSIWSIVL